MSEECCARVGAARDIIPVDGEVIEEIASVNKSTICLAMGNDAALRYYA